MLASIIFAFRRLLGPVELGAHGRLPAEMLQAKSSARFRNIANNRKTQAGARDYFVGPNAAFDDCLSHRRLYSRAAIINENHDLVAFLRAGQFDYGTSLFGQGRRNRQKYTLRRQGY